MRFFTEGDRYQDQYLIESTMDFFDGQLAIARLEDQRYYLQFAPLKKQAPPRSIQQYLAMDHPLVLPYLQVFTEERALVFIRPFVEIRPLLDIVVREPMNEDRVVGWVKSLLQLESMLAKQPLSMYLLSEPQNLGLTPEGELKVIYCGVNQVTQLESTLDWGTLIYILLSGEIPEQPVANLLGELPVSKPMERLLQRSIKSRTTGDLLSLIDSYKKKKNSKGLLGRLFRTRSYGKSVEKAEKKNTKGEKAASQQKDLNITIPEADPSADKKHLEGDPKPSEDKRQEAERLERERLEAERLERELARREKEREQRKLLFRQRMQLEYEEHERLARQFEEYAKQVFYR